jgi:hypothetical protein
VLVIHWSDSQKTCNYIFLSHLRLSQPGGGEWPLEVEVILRPTINWLVCFGVRHPREAHDQIVISARLLLFSSCGALSLTRGWVCNVLLWWLLGLASAVTLGLQVRQSLTLCLIVWFETLLFVASYGLQGHVEGILTHLHMGWGFLEAELKLLLMVSWPVCLGVGCSFGANDQIFLFLLLIRMLLDSKVGHTLWQEYRPIICIAIGLWSRSLRTHNHTRLAWLYPRALGSLLVASSGLAPIIYRRVLLSTLLHVSLIPTSHIRPSAYQLQSSTTDHSSACRSHSHKPQQA